MKELVEKGFAQSDRVAMQLVQWLYHTNHQSAAQRSLRRTKKLMKELVEKGFAQSDRVATAVMTIGMLSGTDTP
jgi:glutamine synthetase adenylyltransferase